MLTILMWVSIIAGGLLILMLLISIIGGLDFDLDVDVETGDSDAGTGGGLGVIKGALTFISVGSWAIRTALALGRNPGIAIAIGVVCGLLAFLLLNYLLKLLMKNEENVNWQIEDALFQRGEVYLKLPAKEGSGIVNIEINGAKRELKAISQDREEIKTGAPVVVVDLEGEFVVVKEEKI